MFDLFYDLFYAVAFYTPMKTSEQIWYEMSQINKYEHMRVVFH